MDATLITVFIISALLSGLLFGWLGNLCGARRGLGVAGFWLGLFFGPVGCLIVLLLPASAAAAAPAANRRHSVSYTQACAMCGKVSELRHRFCPDCGTALPSVLDAGK